MCASDLSLRPRKGWARLLAIVSLAASAAVAQAQTDKDAEQVKRLRLQVRQVQQQQQQAQEAQAKADQARQQAEQALQAQSSDLTAQRAQTGAASRRAAGLSKELDALKAEHAQTLSELAALKQQLQVSRQAHEASTLREGRLTQAGQQLSAQLQRCGSDNAALADLGLDILQRYENKGVAEVLSANEPFVQTGRVKLENLKADYLRRIDAARFKSPATGSKAEADTMPPAAGTP